MQQVEFIAVKRLLHGVDDDIHLIVRMKFGDLVPLTHGSSVPLLQVGRTPRCVQMMDGNGTLLGIHARAEHRSGTEQYTD